MASRQELLSIIYFPKGVSPLLMSCQLAADHMLSNCSGGEQALKQSMSTHSPVTLEWAAGDDCKQQWIASPQVELVYPLCTPFDDACPR